MSRPDLTEIADLIISTAVYNVFVSLPVKVTAVNSAKGTVTVQPGTRRRRPNGTIESLATSIPDVPVFQLVAGSHVVSAAVQVGDTGLLLMANESLGAWLRDGEVKDPPISGRFNPAIFLPAVQPENTRQALPDEGLKIGSDTSNVQVKDAQVLIDSPAIDLGTGGPGVARQGDAIQLPIDTVLTGTFVAGPPATLTLTVAASGSITGSSGSVTAKD